MTYQLDQHFLENNAPEMLADFSVPAVFASLTEGEQFHESPFFFLGARGSGVACHQHGEAWNAVVHGRKRWFLYPREW